MDDLQITLVLMNYRDNPYIEKLLPAFMSFLVKKYKKADIRFLISPAPDYDSSDPNCEWEIMIHSNSLTFDVIARLKDSMELALIRLDTALWYKLEVEEK